MFDNCLRRMAIVAVAYFMDITVGRAAMSRKFSRVNFSWVPLKGKKNVKITPCEKYLLYGMIIVHISFSWCTKFTSNWVSVVEVVCTDAYLRSRRSILSIITIAPVITSWTLISWFTWRSLQTITNKCTLTKLHPSQETSTAKNFKQ